MEKEVKFNGKEYLNYLQYKDKNSLFNKFNNSKKETKIAIGVFIFILSITILVSILIDSLTYTPSNFNYTWNGILMFLAICAGLAWIIHGFGFILIRR